MKLLGLLLNVRLGWKCLAVTVVVGYFLSLVIYLIANVAFLYGGTLGAPLYVRL